MTNLRVKLFLDYLACTNLSLLNGCKLGDVLGDFTSVNYNGSSVVDYVATSPNIWRMVTRFSVCDLNKFSDHKPCITHLAVRHHLTVSEDILKSCDLSLIHI